MALILMGDWCASDHKGDTATEWSPRCESSFSWQREQNEWRKN